MEKPLEIHAAWDDEAQVWIATSEDVAGLCAEAATFDELVDIVSGLVPDLLELNEAQASAGTVPIHVTAERTSRVRLHG